MPTNAETEAAAEAMLKNDPVVMGMLTKAERLEVACAGLIAAEQERERHRKASCTHQRKQGSGTAPGTMNWWCQDCGKAWSEPLPALTMVAMPR